MVESFGSNASADTRLAADIADALAEAGLVPRSDVAQVRAKLAAGTAREADWGAWLAPGLGPMEDEDVRSH